ncbi:hypothetical protein EGW08_006017 [Elysia chlorotica]|uniref:Pseudouridine synthase RsuA/RluA-like domain-containing protein n=1 Tax=Elysia chlorotica TaxID=188477 RepID=A0A3S1HU77_ELYCH|nr:hypothetical protein EGW08_006017 [Elysia chlorotica]
MHSRMYKLKCIRPVLLLLARQHSTHYNGRSILANNTEVLAEDIYKSIVRRDDNIIVLNKPVGLSVYGSTLNNVSSESASINDVLPELREKLEIPHLEIGLSLKSFYSGLVILCCGPDSKKELEHVLKQSAAQKSQIFSYLVLSVGQPSCSQETDLTAYIMRDFFHGREMSIIQEKNNSARKTGSMMSAAFNVRTLQANEDLGVALLEVSINRDKWEAVEALMSHYLSPVLGDCVYSTRTQYVMGVPFRASAHSVLPGPQRLPPALNKALEEFDPTWQRNSGSMPLFMHRHKIHLNKFPSKNSPPLNLTAPLPNHFVSLLKHLNLYTNSIVDK